MHNHIGSRDRWIAIGVAAALLFVAWLLYAIQASSIDARSRAESLDRASEISSAYASNVSATLELIDNAVRFVASYAAENGVAKTARLVRQNKLYGALLGNVGIYDARGVGEVVTDRRTVHVDVHDRRYFQDALANRGSDLLIGTPIVGRGNRVLSIPFARPVRRADGTTVGVVSTVLAARALTYSYDRATLGKRGMLALVTADGTVLLRFTPDRPISAGRLSAAVASRVLAGSGGSFLSRSDADGVLRADAYRRVNGYPVIVSAGLAYDDVAAQNAGVRGGILLRSIGTSIVVLLLLAAWLHQQTIQRRLMLSNAQADEAREEALAATRAKSDFLADDEPRDPHADERRHRAHAPGAADRAEPRSSTVTWSRFKPRPRRC